jgi:hypothetical protein
VRILGKELKYVRWNYGVDWNQDGQRKLRHFETREEAQVLFEQKKRNFANPTLFRFRANSYLERVLNTNLVWRRYKIQIRVAPIILAAWVIFLVSHWRVFK